jgi:nitronate monooxygenase
LAILHDETISLPPIIQGGMGAGISWWHLARTVAKLGQVGVVSGTALDLILARRLQDGDPTGDHRRAIAAFPFPEMAQRVLDRWYLPGGRPPGQPYKNISMHSLKTPRAAVELTIVANFVEVFLAKEGHDGVIGINYLEKIQTPHLPSIYGAMLAGVTVILMGAGIPKDIPGVIDAFVHHQPTEYPLKVTGAVTGDEFKLRFDPREYMESDLPPLHRPYFLPIIASNTLAVSLMKKSNGRIHGFIIEGPTAGGHNAPPRGALKLAEDGQPLYGERDIVDLEAIKELGLPFWIAGSAARPEKLREVLALGGAGIQVGTAFAFCEESGLLASYRDALIKQALEGKARVYTDAVASPTGFPFKVALLEKTMSEPDVYQSRQRICDLGFLRESYRTSDGDTGYRCASEPIEDYVKKGGTAEGTAGKKCLCNSLMANIGMPQIKKNGTLELPLITCGDDLVEIGRFLAPGAASYTAADVIRILLEGADKQASTVAAPEAAEPKVAAVVGTWDGEAV